MTTESDRPRAEVGATQWQWSLLNDIELLEELIAEQRGFRDADDALAAYETALSRALRHRRAQWRARTDVAPRP
jgi:hypothetical protein